MFDWQIIQESEDQCHIHDRKNQKVTSIEPDTLKNKNSYKWFLLFATKSHWREDSDYEGIEKGLQWLVKNYRKEGITSLALPALGCGLGKLSWHKMGPLMCTYLNQMDTKSIIYLPMEKNIVKNELTPNFLLSLKSQ